MSAETWYVLESGEVGDPHEIEPDDKGVLRHKDGRAVAYAPHGPRSRSVDADAERAKTDAARRTKAAEDAKKAADKASDQAKPSQTSTRDMKPKEPAQHYRTRDMKND
jgi:hypothetical protein